MWICIHACGARDYIITSIRSCKSPNFKIAKYLSKQFLPISPAANISRYTVYSAVYTCSQVSFPSPSYSLPPSPSLQLPFSFFLIFPLPSGHTRCGYTKPGTGLLPCVCVRGCTHSPAGTCHWLLLHTTVVSSSGVSLIPLCVFSPYPSLPLSLPSSLLLWVHHGAWRGIRKRFIRILLGVDRCSLIWGSRRGLLEVYWGWTDAASAGHLEEVY